MPPVRTEASEAQKRIVVSLDRETAELLDKVGGKLSAAVKATAGVAVDLSRVDVIRSLAAGYEASPANSAE